MPALIPVANSWYELKADYGVGHGAIPAGAQLQLTHTDVPDEAGTASDTVLMRFLERSSITGRVCQRRLSVRTGDFAKMFRKGSEPEELKHWDDGQRNRPGA